MKGNRHSPPKVEWDFEDKHSAEKLQGRLYYGFMYEYCRSIPWVIKAFKKTVSYAYSRPWNAFFMSPLPAQVEVRIPAKPFLSQYSEAFQISDLPASYDRLLAPVGFPRLPFSAVDFEGTFGDPPPGIPRSTPIQKAIKIGEEWIEAEDARSIPSEEILKFGINWEFSNDAIVEALRERLPDMRLRPERMARGKGGDRLIWANLRALGAWRLLRCFQGNVFRVAQYASSVNAKLRFVRDEDWVKAAQRAQSIMDSWSERVIDD